MEARLSAETLSRIQAVIQDRHLKRNATKWEILSLVGLLQHAAKLQEMDLFYPPEQRVPVWFAMVAYLRLEWSCSPTTTKKAVSDSPDRCFRFLGLCMYTSSQMIPVSVASRLVSCCNNGQVDGAYHYKLCYLGYTHAWAVSAFSMWQKRGGSCS